MFLFEGFKEDQNTVQRYATYKKALDVFKKEKPECVLYGENRKGKEIFYTDPYGCSLDKLRLMTKAAAPEKRTFLALYADDVEDLEEFIKKGYMVKADPRLHEALAAGINAEDVEKLIDDLYELRHTSLQTEGEYGLGNLVFKELRGMGYLDQLKELKKVLEGQELSLFAPGTEPTAPFDEKQALLDNPNLLNDDALDMQEDEPEKYFYDEDPNNIDQTRLESLREGLVNKAVNLYKLNEEEATKVVDTYLGTK